MTGDSFRVDSFAAAPLSRSANEALDQAMLRAYSIERSVDYGCSLEDVLKLQMRVETRHAWPDVALQLAADNEFRAAHAVAIGQPGLASRFLLHAAACCRVAQAGLEDDTGRRLDAYSRQARNFRAAMEEAPGDRGPEYFEVVHNSAPHAAWLFRASGLEAGGAAVVVWGGADGWCEAFHASVPFYLEQDLSVCLLELPGQGLARLQHNSMLRPDFTQLVSSALDELVARGASQTRLGAVGHSAGGSLVLAAAAADQRIRACCSNGGSPELNKALTKYPRVAQRFARMLGHSPTEADVGDFFDSVDLPKAASRMRGSLLCLQGGRDPIVSNDEAHRLVALRGSDSASMAYWPEGVHCLYNHAVERNSFITDWFAHQLADSSGIPNSSRRSQ